MKAELSPSWYKFFNYSTLTLSAIGLLADILGIGKLAYDVIVARQLSDLGFKMIVLVLVFLFGVGLGVISIKGFQNTSLLSIAQFYAWVYVAIACLSYLGISFSLNKQGYTFGTYVAFVFVILAELLAMYALHVVIDDHDIRQYSIPILGVCLVHAILVVYAYVFIPVPVSLYLAGDLFFFTAMTLIGSAMLGDIGFGTMLSRIWAEVNKNMPTSVKTQIREKWPFHSHGEESKLQEQSTNVDPSDKNEEKTVNFILVNDSDKSGE